MEIGCRCFCTCSVCYAWVAYPIWLPENYGKHRFILSAWPLCKTIEDIDASFVHLQQSWGRRIAMSRNQNLIKIQWNLIVKDCFISYCGNMWNYVEIYGNMEMNTQNPFALFIPSLRTKRPIAVSWYRHLRCGTTWLAGPERSFKAGRKRTGALDGYPLVN